IGDEVAAAITAEREAGLTEQHPDEQRLIASMRLLRSAALLGIEVELSPTQREWNQRRWTDAMDKAIETTPSSALATLLQRRLMIAGRRGRIPADQLARQYPGTGGWAETLAAFARLGALRGDPTNDYRVDRDLATLWRDAGPRLRRAMRANPLALPGG